MGLVIAGHAWSEPGGAGLGVDIFFVLSGFLITCLLLGEHAATGGISLRKFYARRALRILPAFYVLVAVLAAFALVGALAEATREGIGHWSGGALVSLAYLANVQMAFNWLPAVPMDLRHAWSLAEEEQFYLLWPMVLLLLLRARANSRRLAGALLLIVAASAAEQLLLWHDHGATRTRLWFAPDTHLAPIAVGCLAGVIFSRRMISDRVIRRLAPFALFACAVAVVLPPFDHAYLYDGPFTLFPFAAAIVLLAVAANVRWLAWPFEVGPIRATGRVSYGIYLWHLPLIGHFGPTIGIPGALAAALASYYVIERRFLRTKRRFAVTSDSPNTDRGRRHPVVAASENIWESPQVSTAS